MTGELDFFDTNVLVAASVREHPHHPASIARLAQYEAGGGACAAHTLAEVYSNLTRFPKGYSVAPLDALRILSHIHETFHIVALTPRETLLTIEACAELDLRGAIVYDALLVACARKIKARHIYTHNIKHFRVVAPDLASIIVEP